MPGCSRLKYLYLAYLSQPAAERTLYRFVSRLRPRSIVELGIPSLARSGRLISVAQRYADDATIRYTGIDSFEDRPSAAMGPSLKDAFRALRPMGVRLWLVPGDPAGALNIAANSLAGTDLLIIGPDHESASLARAWFFIPRMLHAGSVVLLDQPAAEEIANRFRVVPAAEISHLSRQATRRRAA